MNAVCRLNFFLINSWADVSRVYFLGLASCNVTPTRFIRAGSYFTRHFTCPRLAHNEKLISCSNSYRSRITVPRMPQHLAWRAFKSMFRLSRTGPPLFEQQWRRTTLPHCTARVAHKKVRSRCFVKSRQQEIKIGWSVLMLVWIIVSRGCSWKLSDALLALSRLVNYVSYVTYVTYVTYVVFGFPTLHVQLCSLEWLVCASPRPTLPENYSSLAGRFHG
jgi:hypothetical protein